MRDYSLTHRTLTLVEPWHGVLIKIMTMVASSFKLLEQRSQGKAQHTADYLEKVTL
jgi:hypothetical protein